MQSFSLGTASLRIVISGNVADAAAAAAAMPSSRLWRNDPQAMLHIPTLTSHPTNPIQEGAACPPATAPPSLVAAQQGRQRGKFLKGSMGPKTRTH